MRETDFLQADLGSVKSHEEILQLIEEIKEIEKNFHEIEIEESIIPAWETVEPEIITEEAKPIPISTAPRMLG